MPFWCSGLIVGAYSGAGCGGRQRAFAGGYEKAANQAAGLSFVVVFECVFFKADDLLADPVIHLSDALL